jgi:hypothetical protein
MRRNWMRRTAVVAALAILFALAAPAQAAGWATWKPGPDLIQKAWQWITGLLAPQVVVGPSLRSDPTLEKDNGMIDPMGGKPSPPPPSSGGIDPMG